jgi:hypothetical protein
MSQLVWAAWHPRHGYEIPGYYEGAVAFVDLDEAARLVRSLNSHDKTNNRTGWRVVKTMLVRAP